MGLCGDPPCTLYLLEGGEGPATVAIFGFEFRTQMAATGERGGPSCSGAPRWKRLDPGCVAAAVRRSVSGPVYLLEALCWITAKMVSKKSTAKLVSWHALPRS